jgi:hypothetical protein
MNRLILIAILALVIPVSLNAQIGWTEHIIADNFDGAIPVYAIDLDDDGDIDVLGAAYHANDITWWENDGNENFTEHTIADNFEGANSVYAIDLDDDGDVDVLGTAFTADDITWWENDGNENFTEHTIAGTFDGARSVYAIDLDDDGDVDVLGAAYNADDITWWENDGNENFTEHTIAGTFDGARSVYAIDIEPDGDVDVLGAASDADDITWWENDGNENFTEHTIAGNFNGTRSVYAIDLDNDDDVDVLGAAFDANDITWWENDGNENFTEHTIADNFGGANSVFAIDLDDDGDVDILGAALNDDDVAWWQSDLIKAHDVGTVAIDIPSTLPEDTTLNPHAIVKNFGINTETFNVTCNIEPGSYTSTTVSNLAPSESIRVTFPDDFTFESGTYTVTVYTQLAGDNYSDNDTLVEVIEATGVHDAGTVTIDIPSTLPENTTLYPRATVTNSGTVSASFDVTCEIEPGAYASTTIGNISPGESTQVTFPDAFIFVSGTYTVTVYTQLVGDVNPSNDTLEKVIETYDPGVAEGSSVIPEAFTFSAPTISKGKDNIKFSLPQTTKVDLLVYDVTGRLSQTVISRRFDAGIHTLHIDLNLSAGIYFYNLKTENHSPVVRKFLLIN